MTNPTPEQIEAAAEAIQADKLLCHMDGSAVPFTEIARAALVAAAGVTPQEPRVTEAELNRIISPVLFNSMKYPEPHRMLGKDFSELRGALVRALIEGLTEPDLRGKLKPH